MGRRDLKYEPLFCRLYKGAGMGLQEFRITGLYWVTVGSKLVLEVPW